MKERGLEFLPGHGDEGLAQVKYVLCHPARLTDSDAIVQSGLTYQEGRSTFSTLLPIALQDSVFIQVPPDRHAGYAVFTTMYVDRAARNVSGTAMAYVEARDRLSFYSTTPTEETRMRIEEELARGAGFDTLPRMVLEPQYIVGLFPTSLALQRLTRELEVSARSLESIELVAFEHSLASFFRLRSPADAVLLPAVLHDIVVGTIVSCVLSRFRRLRLQGLMALGYQFSGDGQLLTDIPKVTLQQQLSEIEQLNLIVSRTELFVGELSWLRTYATGQLEFMRVELDGAA